MAVYADEVVADTPLFYWPMDGADTSPLDEHGGATGITISGATALAAGNGPLHVSQDTGCWQFDGINDSGQAAVNLSVQTILTVEFWLWWNAFANDDDLALEYGSGNSTGGFVADPNESASTRFQAWMPTGSGANHAESIARPSAAAWHHYVIIFDRVTATAANQVDFWVDGVDVAETVNTSNDITGNFGNLTLNLMCRNNASLFGAGKLAHFAIFSGALGSARISAHFNAADDAAALPPANIDDGPAPTGFFDPEVIPGGIW